MKALSQDTAAINSLLCRQEGAPPRKLQLQVRPLPGGLEAAAIFHITARYRDAQGKPRVRSLVAKRLNGPATREALIYEQFVSAQVSELSPRLLAVKYRSDQAILYLEAIRPANRWPWRETRVAERVLEGLARLHATPVGPRAACALARWDYESELLASARSTLELLERHRRHQLLSGLRPFVPAMRRLVLALPAIRRQLLSFGPFGTGPVHGDVHPGNALLRRRRGSPETALLDWGRARIGSPLEDVVSWLQSLGYWEPEARRRHDTLLARYLSARGENGRPSSDLRAACWLAGASNGLSGALRHHLWVARDEQATSPQRTRAVHAARDWLRVLRRADAYSG